MKKIIALFLLSVSFFWIQLSSAATNNCWKIDSKNIDSLEMSQLLKDCQPKWAMEGTAKKEIWSFLGITLSASSNELYKIENAKGKIMAVTNKLVILATIIAIGWIVFSGYLFVTSYGNNDKIKKAKEGIKWSLIWLLIALVSQQLVNAVINLVYDISG